MFRGGDHIQIGWMFNRLFGATDGSLLLMGAGHADNPGPMSRRGRAAGVRGEVEGKLGMEVDISVIRKGGPFDNPPFIPLPE